MARPERFTVEEVIDALRKGYTPAGAAQILHCDPDTIRNYARKYVTVRKMLKARRADLVDLAEIGLRRALTKYEPWAISFTLKTLGKNEGYVERTEQTGPDGGPVTIRIVDEVDNG